MHTLLTRSRKSVLISLLIIFPFIVLEIINRSHLPGTFPYLLFTILWLIMSGIVHLAKQMIRIFHADETFSFDSVSMIRLVTIIVLVFFWIWIIIDQMPCFLGVNNCD